jgi:hypothetical protein
MPHPEQRKQRENILHIQRKDGIPNFPGHGKIGNGKKDKWLRWVV